MSDLAIRVENLGKRYRIGGRQVRYRRFTETVMDTFSAPIRRLKNLGKPTPPEETIWALKDVSFEVERGEVLGIIGRNGAGKTTLLKILSRITEPTEGRAEIHGRVGSLLEVGTGFHPELTGRENVYLNGAILGMKRAEIDRKFDEIVEFSGVEKFLDTPVKRYSSGMRVRLAFSVAAHLEPEIMLIDEVLAVGDAQFQRKCLGKMGEVAREGRTVLFVSHNMGAITRLCSRGLLLTDGVVGYDGFAEQAVARYLGGAQLSRVMRRAESLEVVTSFVDHAGRVVDTWRYGSELIVHVEVRSGHELRRPAVDLAFFAPDGRKVFAIQSDKLAGGRAVSRGTHVRFAFVLHNVGLAVPNLAVDLGLRLDGSQAYAASWRDIATISVSARNLPNFHVSDAVVCIPATVQVAEAPE